MTPRKSELTHNPNFLGPSKPNSRYFLDQQSGFSLVEILIALSLVAVMFAIVSVNTDTERQKLDEAMTKIERAVRFATNESILRNSLVRLRLNLDASPVEYTIEYTDSSQFTLPQATDTSKMSLKEREFEQEKQKKLDSEFATIPEFLDGGEPLAEVVNVYGLATTYYPSTIISGSVSIYFYPTGEKDSALILFYTSEEMATLAISPFEDRFEREYSLFSQQELANLEQSLENKTKELVQNWLKE